MGTYIPFGTDGEKLRERIDSQREGKIVGLTGGTFDLFHDGHVFFLAQCRKKCDILVVDVTNDERVRLRKGPDRPALSANKRAGVVASNQYVDYTTIVRSTEEEELLESFNPTVRLAKIIRPEVIIQEDGRWTPKYVNEVVDFLGYNPDLISIKDRSLRGKGYQTSTTGLMEKIRNSRPEETRFSFGSRTRIAD